MTTPITCCTKPTVHTMDYTWPMFPKIGEPIVTKINRVCTNCYTHWFGTEGNIKQYTRAEWDAELQESNDTDVAAALVRANCADMITRK